MFYWSGWGPSLLHQGAIEVGTTQIGTQRHHAAQTGTDVTWLRSSSELGFDHPSSAISDRSSIIHCHLLSIISYYNLLYPEKVKHHQPSTMISLVQTILSDWPNITHQDFQAIKHPYPSTTNHQLSCNIHQLQPSIINQGWSSTVNNHQLLLATIHQLSTSSRASSIPYHVLLLRLSKGCEGNQGEVAAHWTATGRNRIINSWSTILGASWIVSPRIDQALCTEPWYCMMGFSWENGWCFCQGVEFGGFVSHEILGFFFQTKPPGGALNGGGLKTLGATLSSEFITMKLFGLRMGMWMDGCLVIVFKYIF